jgi:hypothetical protein
MARVLTVQTVRFQNDAAELQRSLASFGVALKFARRHGFAGDVTFALGDASSKPLDTATRDSFERIGDEYDLDYEYVYFDENTGSARGQNRLAAAFPATWQLVTNPDVVFGGTSLHAMWQRVGDDLLGIAEARQLPLELPKNYDVATGATSWASGAGSLVRGDVWRAIGGYDDASFFLYCDDVDMSWRVRLAGYTVIHVPSARVFHDKRTMLPDLQRPSPTEILYSALGSYHMARKWGTESDLNDVRERIIGDEYAEARRVIDEIDANGSFAPPVPDAALVAQFAPDGTFGASRF